MEKTRTSGPRCTRSRHPAGANLVNARQLNGKELSYNNLLDLDSALTMARCLPGAAAVVIKHNNPCGAASAETLVEATKKAIAGDPLSAFGSVLGFNRTMDEETAEYLSTPGLFIEAIVAPDYSAAAVGVLTSKPKWRNNVRLMQVGRLEEAESRQQLRCLDGGMLLQDLDDEPDVRESWEVVSREQPDARLWSELEFGWASVRHVKSNAIVLSKESALCGVGAGQMSRVDAVEIAIRKAGERAAGCVLASDAFFPFPDSIHQAAQAGIQADRFNRVAQRRIKTSSTPAMSMDCRWSLRVGVTLNTKSRIIAVVRASTWKSRVL